MKKNPHAVALGSLGGKKPKHYSEAEKEKRRQRLALVRPKKKIDSQDAGNTGACDTAHK